MSPILTIRDAGRPMKRQAIALAYFRGQSHAEIADTLAVPIGTVKSWMRRALSFLKEQLEGANLPTQRGDTGSALDIADIRADVPVRKCEHGLSKSS
jgi:hypothetical protein